MLIRALTFREVFMCVCVRGPHCSHSKMTARETRLCAGGGRGDGVKDRSGAVHGGYEERREEKKEG